MKLYQKIITGGIVIAGLAGFIGWGSKPSAPKANQDNKQAVLNIPTSVYGGRSVAAGDMNGDGLTDLLSTDDSGNVYLHKNLGNGQYEKINTPILNIPTSVYGGRSVAAGDMNGDGLTDLLSTDDSGNVYVHRNLGDLKFE